MDPYSAPSLDHIAASQPLPTWEDADYGPAVAQPAEELDWSLDTAPVASHDEEGSRRIGWLAPILFLLGLLLAGFGALMALLAAAVVGIVVALYFFVPAGPGVSDAEFILVPDTLPVQELPADDVDAEFILVPDTLPATPEAKKAPKAPRKEVPAAPARPEPAGQQAPAPPPVAAPVEADPKGNAAKVSLEVVPLDEAVRRVQGKAGRGEARSTRGH